MNPPPNPQSSIASGTESNSNSRSNRIQQTAWGRPPSQAGARHTLTPLATSDLNLGPAIGTRRPGPSASPSSSANQSASPFHSSFSSVLASSNRVGAVRPLSASPSGSPFSSFQTGATQSSSLPPSQSITSPRSRTVTPLSQFASATSSQSTSQGGGGAAAASGSGGGGGSRSGAYSPSISSTHIGSPTGLSFDRPATLSSSASSVAAGQSSLSKISVAQVLLLLDTISEKEGKAKWDSKAEQIRKLVESNGMDVFPKFFRRLVTGNASKIFPGTSVKGSDNAGNYPLLVEEMRKVLKDPFQAKQIAETIDDADGDIFRDFDLVAFVKHFNLDPAGEAALALAFRTCNRGDLRSKADSFLSEIIPEFLKSIAAVRDSNRSLDNTVISLVVERFATLSPQVFGTDRKLSLDWSVKQRFQELQKELPGDVLSALQLLRIPESHQTILQQLQRNGPSATNTVEAADDLLSSIGLDNLDEHEVANALLFMVFSVDAKHYNPANFVSALQNKSRVKHLDWLRVIKRFDLPALQINQEQFLSLFESLLLVATSEPAFDVQALWGGRWKHRETQLSFLKAFLFCTPEQINVARIPNFRYDFPVDLFAGADGDLVKQAELAAGNQFASADATTAILELILPEEALMLQPDCREIVNHLIQNHMELFLLSAPGFPEPLTPDQHKFIQKCFNVVLLKHTSDYRFALEGLWRQSRDWVFRQLHSIFIEDPMRTNDIFECAQEMGWTEFLLQIVHPLTLDIACVLHRDDDFDIDQWLREAAERQGPENVGSTLLKFLKIKAEDEYRVQRKEQQAPRSVPLLVKTIHALLQIVEDLVSDHESLISIQRMCVATYPRLINYSEGFDEIIDENGRNGNALPEDIDKQMSELFGRMYREELSFREVLELMRRYKTSQDPHEQDLFTCIIHGLFDEYHCYHEYPPEALMKTAVMFGGIINFKLMSGIPLKVGLSLILEAVRDNQPPDSMYKFGVEAIEQLVGRLPEWAGFCSLLIQIPSLRGSSIFKRANEILREQGHDLSGESEANGANSLSEALPLPNGNTDGMPQVDAVARKFRSIHVDPPPKGLFKDPDQTAQDKVLFVLNNLSKENLSSKLKDLEDVLHDEHFHWFASHLVEQRAKLESNFQPLYMKLLEMIGDRTLMAEVLRETYVSVIKMLNAESIMEKDSRTERAQLQNLGDWLGSLTIAKDKPIKHKNIFFKGLLLEGYDTQRLLLVVPFTCRVLAQGVRSAVFKPPNPWLMDILALLMELYHFADMKLNQKFAIEVLCKDFNLDHKTIEPSACIQDRPPQADDEVTNISGAPDGLDVFDELSLGGLNRVVRNERLSPATIMSTLPRLEDVLKYPPSSAGSGDDELVKDIIYRAFDQAIQEIIAPVVERSITIASISTSQLIAKDFACEGDEEKLKSAAREMVRSLAGSLALVTCKEPLRMSITNYIRRPTHIELPEQLMPEGAILMCVNDNLDTACSFVEKAASERAVAEIDRVIEPELEERRRHFTIHPNEPFVSRNLNRWALFIPDPYRLGAGGLNEAQLAVYEGFARHIKGVNMNHAQNMSTDSTGRQLPDVLQEPFTMPNLSTPAEQPALPHSTSQSQQETRMQLPSMPATASQAHVNGFAPSLSPQDKILNLLSNLQKGAQEASFYYVKDLPKDSTIYSDFHQVLQVLITSSRPTGEILARMTAEKICTDLFQGLDGQLVIEVYAFLLAKICHLSELVSRDVYRWLSAHEESYASNVMVTYALLSAGLVEFSRIDMILTKFMSQRNTAALTVLEGLLDLVLFSDSPLAFRADLSSSLEALSLWLVEEPDLEVGLRINEKLKAAGVPEAIQIALSDKVRAKQDQMEYIFCEWIRIYQNPKSTERAFASFLKDMHEKQIINSQEDQAMFLRCCLDICVAAFDHENQRPGRDPSGAVLYLHTDSLAKLIICLVKFQGEANGAVKIKKGLYLESILSLIVLVENHHQIMRGANFNQRVFYRLFSTILCEYLGNGMHQTVDHKDMMLAFAEAFIALQPAHIPSFVYSWLGLISHRVFMPQLLNLPREAGWESYRQLMQVMLAFIGEQLKPSRLTPVIQDLYKGVLRVLLVLHHDFAEFLVENYLYLCNVIPTHCSQLRNLILSAYPQSMPELPDPFTHGLKVDRLDEMKRPPVVAGDISLALVKLDLKLLIDQLLRKGANIDASILQIVDAICTSNQGDALHPDGIDVAAINSLVLYIGQDALATTPTKFEASAPHAALLSKLVKALQPEARYYFLSAIADNLRYPNTHTSFFCKAMLHVFGTDSIDQQDTDIRQQIVRIILERLIVNRPYPWGLVVLLFELDHNTAYRFWELPFMTAAPEIRQILLRQIRVGH